MPVSRFWSSVWTVVLVLFALSLLSFILSEVSTLFGLLPVPLLATVAVIVGTTAGALTYIDWRWGWQPENIGLTRRPEAALWTLVGVGVGAGAGLLSILLTQVFEGRGFTLGLVAGLNLPWLSLLVLAGTAFMVELVFRGVVVSRFQSDLSHKEMLLAATLFPFGWHLIQQLLRGWGLFGPQITAGWAGAMSVALALLFIRFDSVWLSAGLRFGMLAVLQVLAVNQRQIETGGLIVWGGAAAVLLALEWFKHQGLPRRVQPNRGPRVMRTGRTIRGPWGPH